MDRTGMDPEADIPELSVVVPHYDDSARLRLCLQALEEQSFPREKYEVIVSDNDSPSGVEEVAAQFPGTTFLRESRRGAAHARNSGVSAARGQLLAFTDADCRPDREWISEGVRALALVDLVGGAVVVTCEDEDRPTAIELFERVFAFRQSMYVTKRGFAATANLFARRAVFNAVGTFRQGGPEDADWCRRALATGFRIAYAPRAIVRHPARRTWQALARKWDRLIEQSREEARPERSWRARWLWIARSIAVGASPLGHAVRVLLSPRLDGATQRLRCLAVLVRIRVRRARLMLRWRALVADSRQGHGADSNGRESGELRRVSG